MKEFTKITDAQVEASWEDMKAEFGLSEKHTLTPSERQIKGIFDAFQNVIDFMTAHSAANPQWKHVHYRVDFKNRMVLEMRAENGKLTMKDRGYVPKSKITR